MKIGSCISRKNKIERGSLKISSNRKLIKIPIVIAEGKKKGGTSFISAGMHGDELNGINILSSYLSQLDPKKINGTIIMVPIINPIGFHYGERKIRYDDKDLNRCFGKEGNSFSYKFAKTFFNEIVSRCDFGLDLHDSNKRYILLPHTRIFNKEFKEVDSLSRIFGTEIVMKRKPSRGMLALEAMRDGKIPVLTIEIGGGMTISSTYKNDGLRGIKNVLAHHGYTNDKIIVPEKQFVLDDRIGYNSKIRGILSLNKKLGEVLEKNEIIAEVINPSLAKSELIKVRNPGVLFSIKANAYIKQNEKALSILHFKKQKGKIIPTQGKMVENKETSEVHTVTSGYFNKALENMRHRSRNFFTAILNE